MTRRAVFAVALALAVGFPALARSEEVAVRVGDHAGYGRVVFDLPPGAAFTTTTDGNRFLVAFKDAGQVAQPMTLPRFVVSVQGGQDTATLVLEPGARPRAFRVGNRLVVDVAGPAPRPAAAPDPLPDTAMAIPVANRRGTARTAPATLRLQPVPDRKDGTPAFPKQPEAQPAAVDATPEPAHPPAVETAPAVPVTQSPLPTPAAAAPSAMPASLLLRAAPDVGAAAFRRGGMALVVLDRRLPPQPVPDGATWEQGATTTMVRLPVSDGAALRLSRVAAGWSVETVPTAPDAALLPTPADGATRFPVPRPSRVVTVLDPVAGGTLLVGTSLDAGPAAALAGERRTPDLTVLPTWLGVAVAPAADRVDLRATTTGFVLTGAAPVPAARAVAQTRRFDLPDGSSDGSTDALLNRLRAEEAGAAAAEPRARTRARTAAARSLIALGMGAEAQALLQLVATEDPQAATDAEITGLAAVAAVLARRPEEAAALDDSRLDGTDEVALWRGLRDWRLNRAAHHPDPGTLGRFVPLALSYPPTLRRAIWQDVAEAAVEAGAPVPPDTLPPYARARLLDCSGKADEALAAYDALANGPDRRDGARAAWRATELRLASGRITPHDAAAALDRGAFNWRGDKREAAMLLRAVELHAAAGEWRPALGALNEVATAFPDQADAVRTHKAAVLQALLAAEGGGLSALDTVLLAADFGDAVPDGPAGGALARLLAEKLTALDLPARAIPILQGLMQAAPAGEPRAEFGARLAQLLLDGGAPDRAAEALSASAAPDLPAALAETRALLQARVKAADGDLAGATGALSALGTAAADDLRAALLARANDWPGALAALSDLAAKQVPATGPLPDAAQDILVRQASAAAQVPDAAVLLALGRSADRLTGARRDLFRVLTQAPLSGPGDLKRAGQELTAARLVAQRMQAPVTR